MNKKITSVVAYLTWIGLIIACVAGDKDGAKFHLNQALVIWLAGIILGIVAVIPILGWIVGLVGSIFLFVCWIMGLVYAIQEQEKEVPILGKFKLLK